MGARNQALEMADLALRRPSLDDVFLALTQDPTTQDPTEVHTELRNGNPSAAGVVS